jgi:hypothetical protein
MSRQAGIKRQVVSLELQFIALQNSDSWTRRDHLIENRGIYEKYPDKRGIGIY